MISAVVVSHNEGHLLANCLKSISFCDEIILVDLESTDNTKEIAEKYGVNYIYHKRVPIVEIIHTWIQDRTKHDWILIIDPDELCSENLAQEILKIIPVVSEKIGLISVPWRFYFGRYLLKGTQWGGENRKVLLVNRNKFYFSEEVHRSRHLKEGYKGLEIKANATNCVQHFWMQNIKQLINKHKRYLNEEGKSRYNHGYRCTLKRLLQTPFRAFYSSYWKKKGVKDGFIGLFLSFFWAWYETKAELELYKYSNNMKTKCLSS